MKGSMTVIQTFITSEYLIICKCNKIAEKYKLALASLRDSPLNPTIIMITSFII